MRHPAWRRTRQTPADNMSDPSPESRAEAHRLMNFPRLLGQEERVARALAERDARIEALTGIKDAAEMLWGNRHNIGDGAVHPVWTADEVLWEKLMEALDA